MCKAGEHVFQVLLWPLEGVACISETCVCTLRVCNSDAPWTAECPVPQVCTNKNVTAIMASSERTHCWIELMRIGSCLQSANVMFAVFGWLHSATTVCA